MQVSALNVHPVKSTAIRSVTVAVLQTWGLVDDRRWMVVDGDGAMISARSERSLFTIVARTRDVDQIDVDLELTAPGQPALTLQRRQPALTLQRPGSVIRSYTLHGHTVTGADAGPSAAGWLREVLRREDVSLVWCADPSARQLDREFARPGQGTAYADGYPVLLTSTASLARLNDWIADDAVERGEQPPAPVPMQRFRPNVVVDGVVTAFAEDGWRRIRIGSTVLRVAKPCDRCMMTLIDPSSLATGREPIRALARHRQVDGVTLFGQNLIPERTGPVRLGDPVEVLD